MKNRIDINYQFLYWGFGLLLFGALYYLIIRANTPVYFIEALSFHEISNIFLSIQAKLRHPILDSLPSFIHTLAMIYLTISFIKPSKNSVFFATIFWVLFNILFEFGQLYSPAGLQNIGLPLSLFPNIFIEYFSYGIFDWLDICFVFLAGFFVIHHTKQFDMQSNNQFKSRSQRKVTPILLTLPILFIGVGSTLGSYYQCPEEEIDCDNYTHHNSNIEPIYMSYEDLRNAISTDQDKTLDEVGKIYIHQNYLFVNSPNNGIFIYDNQDPTNPIFLTFINIPGNIDLAIKDTYLLVDSYIDLVVIDISDAQNIREVDRIHNVFPYNVYQNIPHEIYLGYVDQNEGVVIGYKEKSNEND